MPSTWLVSLTVLQDAIDDEAPFRCSKGSHWFACSAGCSRCGLLFLTLWRFAPGFR